MKKNKQKKQINGLDESTKFLLTEMVKLMIQSGSGNSVSRLTENGTQQMLLDSEENEDFFEKKDREAYESNHAFANLVKRVDFIENQITGLGDEIVELNEKLQKVKKKQEKTEDSVDSLNNCMDEIKEKIRALEKVVSRLKKKVSDLLVAVRNILYLAGYKWHIKKDEVKATSEKLVRRNMKSQEKFNALIDKEENGKWKGTR